MNKKIKKKQALIMAEPYKKPFNSKVVKVEGDIIEDSVGEIKYATSFNGATEIVDDNINKLKFEDGEYKIGKSVNLAKFNDQTFTQNGVSVVVKDGVITFSGTATADGSMTFNFGSNVTETENDYYYWGAFNNKALNVRFGIITNETINNYTAYEDLTEINKTKLFVNAATRKIEAFFFNFSNGTNLDGFELKPMLIQSETAPTKYYSGSYGIKVEVANGVITLNGINGDTSTIWIWFDFVETLNGAYSFNSFAPAATYVASTRVSLYDNTTEKSIAQLFNNEYSSTIELTNYECKKIGIVSAPNQNYDNLVLKPMLVLGTTAPTTFEPYFKNLLIFDDIEEATQSGITYSVKNGVVVLNGTPTSSNNFNLWIPLSNYIQGNKTYYKKVFYSNTQLNEGNLWLCKELDNYSDRIQMYRGTANVSYNFTYLMIYIETNKTYTNEIFKPMLVKGNIAPTKFIKAKNPYFVSLGQNGKVQYNGLEPREIDLKGNVISKINNQASDKLSNYSLTKNTKVVGLGSLTWEATDKTVNNKYRMSSQSLKSEIVYSASSSIVGNILSTTYKSLSTNDTYLENKGISLETDGTIKIYDPEYNTTDKLEDFKKAIKGTLLMYELKNPTTINTTSFKTFKEDSNATISDDNFTVSSNSITETFKPIRSYDFKVNGFSNVVKSENILKLPNLEETNGGVTYSVKDNVITLNGTATDDYWIWIYFDKTLNGTYSFNCFDKNSITYSPNVRISLYDLTTEVIVANLSNGQTTSTIELNNYNCKRLGIRKVKGQVFNNTIYKLMLTEGNKIPTIFEPYFDPYIESFANEPKKNNLLELQDTEGTVAGVEYTVKNGVVTLNGTPTGITSETWLWFDFNKTLNGTYSFNSFIPKEVEFVGAMRIILYDYKAEIHFVSLAAGDRSVTETISNYECKQIGFSIQPIQVFNNLVFKPMLVEGDKIPTTFRPYSTKDVYLVNYNVEGKNLLEFEDTKTNLGGIEFKIKNGIITINGISSSNQTLYVNLKNKIYNGTYSFNSFASSNTRVDIYIISPQSQTQICNTSSNPIISNLNLQSTDGFNQISFFVVANTNYNNLVIKPMLVLGLTAPTEFEPFYSYTKEISINQPLRKWDYLKYDGVYRQTNEIVLDGSWNVVRNNYLFEDGRFNCSIRGFFPKINNWGEPYSQLYITTTSDLPLLPLIELQKQKKKGIALNDGNMIIKLDDSTDNSLNNWTVEKINNYFKQNPITITYKTVDQTFEATSLTRLLLKNGYNKITAFDSINNNAIVEYLEYYKSKGD